VFIPIAFFAHLRVFRFCEDGSRWTQGVVFFLVLRPRVGQREAH